MLPRNLAFYYEGEPLEVVSKFKYFGIVFTTGGSFFRSSKDISRSGTQFRFEKEIHSEILLVETKYVQVFRIA